MEGAYAGMVYIWAWLAFYEQRTRSIGPVPFFQFRQGRQCIIVPNCWLASHPAGPMTSPWPVSTKHQMLGNQPCSLLPDRRPWLKFGKQGPPASLSKLALATPALHSGLQGRVIQIPGLKAKQAAERPVSWPIHQYQTACAKKRYSFSCPTRAVAIGPRPWRSAKPLQPCTPVSTRR